MADEKTRKRTRSNGEGGVRQDRARGRWVGTATVGFELVVGADGIPRQRQLRRSVTGRTKAEALSRLREVQTAAEQGVVLARRDLTVGRYLDDWLKNVLPGSVTRGTQTNYEDVVRLYLRPILGQTRLRALTVRDVKMMLNVLAEPWTEPSGKPRAAVSPNTRRLVRSVLRRALRHAEGEGLVTRNVARIADGVKVGTPEGRSLSPDQARYFLSYLDTGWRSPLAVTDDQGPHRLAAAWSMALALGLRRGELLGLSWADVDLTATAPKLTVRRALKRLPDGLALEDTKTRQSRRTIHLPLPLVDALRSHRARQVEERLALGGLWETAPLGVDLIFRTPRGTAVDPDNFRNLTYRVTETAGLGRWSPHELRHSAASLLIAHGIPLKTVSEVLGHSSIRVTSDVYAHLMEPARAEAAEAMAAVLWA